MAAVLALAATSPPAAAGFMCARPASAVGNWLDARYEAATAPGLHDREDGFFPAVGPLPSIFARAFDPPQAFSEIAFEYAEAVSSGPTTMLQEIFVRVYLLQKFGGAGNGPVPGGTPGFDPPAGSGGDLPARDATTAMPGPSGLMLLAAAVPVLGGYFGRRKRPAA